MRVFIYILYSLAFACNTRSPEDHNVAANKEVDRFLKNFEGRGALADTSTLLPAATALKSFSHPADIKIELVLSEPQVLQPVNMNFDSRGRLWVVQYNQYPYPKGLKITKIDEHLRSEFDKPLLPPPGATKGADKITMYEDTDHDGRYDTGTDVITGLNIATSVAFGRRKIWVLNPPFLLAYPDLNNDGKPDSNPEVHLEGFGIHDTHAVANSLTFGPDGWLYGAQGSTVHSTVSSSVTKNVHFKGQAIWRYHPITKVFEVFAEGGGNTFHIEMDTKGRIYSGDNGTDRGQYYKQGGYYVKNLGKHGLHTNPYSYGHLANMKLVGEKTRFTHAFIRYEGDELPRQYFDKMIAINPLQNYIQLARFEKNGSTFANIDENKLMQTNDKWFRPVDIKLGPDGAVYVADWSDSRLTHIDPRDNWDKKSGRIYAIRNAQLTTPLAPFDVSKSTDEQLVKLLSHKNKWFRQQAIQEFANRSNNQLLPALTTLFKVVADSTALELLWAINISGGFNDMFAQEALKHADPFVRMWAVRLIGDKKEISDDLKKALVLLAEKEIHAEVKSQLLATGKRIDGSAAISIALKLLKSNDDSSDPDIPLQFWWLIESKSQTHRKEIIQLFADKKIWQKPIVQQILLERIVQRYLSGGTEQDVSTCAELLDLCPTPRLGKGLIKGIELSLAGNSSAVFPGYFLESVQRFKIDFPDQILSINLRTNSRNAIQQATKIVANRKTDRNRRTSIIKVLGETAHPQARPLLLNLLHVETDSTVLAETLTALQHFEGDSIAERIIHEYETRLSANTALRELVLFSLAARSEWSSALLQAVKDNRINKKHVPAELVSRLKMIKAPAIANLVTAIWPEMNNTSADKTAQINRTAKLIRQGSGNVAKGKEIYMKTCGVCHTLFSEGGQLGPDLTGYDRKNINDLVTNIIDPDAYIREGFVNYTIETADGRIISGLLKSHTELSTTIQPFGGSPVTLSASRVKSLTAETHSLMPEALIKGMSDGEIQALFAYITKE